MAANKKADTVDNAPVERAPVAPPAAPAVVHAPVTYRIPVVMSDAEARKAIAAAMDGAVDGAKGDAHRQLKMVAAIVSLADDAARQQFIDFTLGKLRDDDNNSDDEPSTKERFLRQWQDGLSPKLVAAETEKANIVEKTTGANKARIKILTKQITAAEQMFRRAASIAALLFEGELCGWPHMATITWDLRAGWLQAPINMTGKIETFVAGQWVSEANKLFATRKVKRPGAARGRKKGNGTSTVAPMTAETIMGTPLSTVMDALTPRLSKLMENGKRITTMTTEEELAAISVWRAISDYYGGDVAAIKEREAALLAS